MIQIIDDCIQTAQQNEIKNYFFKNLPWYYKEDVTLGNGVENGRPALDHWFYEKGKNVSENFIWEISTQSETGDTLKIT